MNFKKGFTLIEMMIAITIVAILSLTTYAPYSYYQNKAKLKITAREISQLLYESRNMAINWALSNSWNVSIWVYFDNSSLLNNTIKVFSYPYDSDEININNMEWWNTKLIRSLILQPWVQIDWFNISGLPDPDKTNLLLFFNSINWDIKYYTWNPSKNNISGIEKLSIKFSYKWSTSPNLQKTIDYFTKTNITDY